MGFMVIFIVFLCIRLLWVKKGIFSGFLFNKIDLIYLLVFELLWVWIMKVLWLGKLIVIFLNNGCLIE